MSRLAAALIILVPLAAAAASFRFPLSECGKSGGCYVTAYRDLNRSSGSMRDWSCRSKTYDNHSGSDFGIGGFAGMDANGSRPVVAGAAGTVIGVSDGMYDRSTTTAGNTHCGAASSCGNYVKLKHADGRTTIYCHMKKGSVAVARSAKVQCGQVLGRVGSSGCSTGPHLHFGLDNSAGTTIDPYKAVSGCSGSGSSAWVSQGSYLGKPGSTCECTPSCSGKTCGSDGCGGSCGTCAAGKTCSAGACVCVPVCGAKACGPDGCGGSCGACSAGTCSASGQCVASDAGILAARDAGPADASRPDAGALRDAGQRDAGLGDAALASADSGSPGDSGGASVDSGEEPPGADAAAGAPGTVVPSACGCQGTSRSAPSGGLALLLAAALRRKKRAEPPLPA